MDIEAKERMIIKSEFAGCQTVKQMLRGVTGAAEGAEAVNKLIGTV